MYNLILKEFLVQKKTLLYGFIYTIFTAYAFGNIMPGGGAIYSLAPYALVYLFVTYSCGYDEKNKTDIIFNSLPVNRVDIVMSKYFAVFLFAAYGIICSAVLGFIGMNAGILRVSRTISINDILIAFSGGIIFASIFYPLYFKFGMVKMKLVNIFLFMLFMFAPSFLTDYAAKHPESSVVRNVISLFTNTSAETLRLLLLAAACIVLLTSILISIQIYKNKDF
jgi:ABC-type transport system involved in multi-copper enzyme maturation permease subunit